MKKNLLGKHLRYLIRGCFNSSLSNSLSDSLSGSRWNFLRDYLDESLWYNIGIIKRELYSLERRKK